MKRNDNFLNEKLQTFVSLTNCERIIITQICFLILILLYVFISTHFSVFDNFHIALEFTCFYIDKSTIITMLIDNYINMLKLLSC